MSDQTAARNELVAFLTPLDVFSNDTRRQELLQHAGLEFINDIEPNLPKGTYVSTLLNKLKQSGGKTYLQPLFDAVAVLAKLTGDPLTEFNQLRDAYLGPGSAPASSGAGSAGQPTASQPAQAAEPKTADLRRVLTDRFDDDELNVLSMDYYPEVYAKFTLGMTMAQKINLLLDYCRRNPDKGLENLRDTMKRVNPALASVL